MITARPTVDPLEPRRLFAFALDGPSTITGTDFQTIDKVAPLPGGGYVAAGLFSEDTNFGGGQNLDSLGRSDVFLKLVTPRKTDTLTIGGESRERLRFTDDRVDFAARPGRVDEGFTFGVSAEARRADEYVSQLKLGPDGKLYVALLFRRDVSLDTRSARGRTLTAAGGFEDEFFDSAILRYDLSGDRFDLERVTQIGGPFNDLIQDFTFDAAGNLFVAGSFERRADFDPGSGSRTFEPLGRGDAFAAKYSTDGKLRWLTQLGGDTSRDNEIESAYAIAPAPGGGVYVGGTVTGDAELSTNGRDRRRDVVEVEDLTDGFTMRLDAAGKLDWVRTQGGDNFDGVRALAPAPGGGVYNVGYFEEEADLDPRAGDQTFEINDDGDGDTDLFFTRLDADGDARSVKTINGDGYELVAAATTTAAGELVIAGSLFGTADVDPSGRRRILRTGDTGIDDANQTERDRAYAGFVAVYGPNLTLRRATQIDGRGEEDLFLTGAALTADDALFVAGRYRDGVEVPGDAADVRTGLDGEDDEYREDGFLLALLG